MMQKGIMVALVGALLLFSACVDQEKPSAAEVLNKSNAAMENVGTYSFVVRSSMLLVGDASFLGGGAQKTDLVWDGQVDGKNRRMHIKADMVSGSSNNSVEQYVIGGKQYVKVPMFGWIMNETGSEFWDAKTYAKLQPDTLNVSSVLVGEEEVGGVNCYVVDMNLSSTETLASMMQQPGATEGIKEIRRAEMREWIAKDSFLLMRSETIADIVGTGMEAYINTTIDFSGYDSPVSIELPAEAENALDINQLMAAVE